MRKSDFCSPVMAVPSTLKTLQVTGTICDVTRILATGPSEADTALLAAGAMAINSPVAGSRCHVTSESSCRAFGSVFFCVEDFAEDFCGGVAAPEFDTVSTSAEARQNKAASCPRRMAATPRARPPRRWTCHRTPFICWLIEIEIAEGLFDGSVFGFLQALGKFSGENIFLGFFCFHRRAEFCFHRFALLAQKIGCVVEIDGRRRLWRRHVRKHDAQFPIDSQLRVTAGTFSLKGFAVLLARHGHILRQFRFGRVTTGGRSRLTKLLQTKTAPG